MKYGQNKHLMCGFAVAMSTALMAQVSPAEKVETKDEYPLKTCIVSGDRLDAMGEPYVYEYEGQEIRFCCEDCVSDFLKKPDKYLAKLHAAQNKYPLKTCVVSGDKLDAMGEPYVYEHEGQEIRFCCEDCVTDFLKKPEKYMAKLQAAKDRRAEEEVEHSHGHGPHKAGGHHGHKGKAADDAADGERNKGESEHSHGHGPHKAGGHHDH